MSDNENFDNLDDMINSAKEEIQSEMANVDKNLEEAAAAIKERAAKEAVPEKKGEEKMEQTNTNIVKQVEKPQPKWKTSHKIFYALGTIFMPGAFNLGHLCGKKCFETQLEAFIEENYKK